MAGANSSRESNHRYIGAGEAFGLEALEDQQLGGLIMWVPGGLAYLLAGHAMHAPRP